jgi:uncharacterized membrane protein
MRSTAIGRLIGLVLLLVLPFVFAEALSNALLKLGLSRNGAVMTVAGIFIGSVVNVPITRVAQARPLAVDQSALTRLREAFPEMQRRSAETVVAVNVGGCVIPVALAAYQVMQLAARGEALGALLAGVLVNILLCHRVARLVPGVGIMLPALLPAAAAAGTALLLAPEHCHAGRVRRRRHGAAGRGGPAQAPQGHACPTRNHQHRRRRYLRWHPDVGDRCAVPCLGLRTNTRAGADISISMSHGSLGKA